jgi:3-methyladenine DNA glycosylase AlkD
VTTIEVEAAAEAARWEAALRTAGTPERAEQERAYLKSDLEFAGVSVPAMRRIVVSWCRTRPGLDRAELVAMAAALWASALYERRQCAVLLLERSVRLLEAADLRLVEYLLRDCQTWALVDGLAAAVAGDLAERYPGQAGPVLDQWAASESFWLRRSALLALLHPLRRGEGDFARFSRYADAMLEEREFFVRKAIGWVLRETAKRRPELVAGWLGPRTHRISGVAIREACKPLPPDVRSRLLAGYRNGSPVHD